MSFTAISVQASLELSPSLPAELSWEVGQGLSRGHWEALQAPRQCLCAPPCTSKVAVLPLPSLRPVGLLLLGARGSSLLKDAPCFEALFDSCRSEPTSETPVASGAWPCGSHQQAIYSASNVAASGEEGPGAVREGVMKPEKKLEWLWAGPLRTGRYCVVGYRGGIEYPYKHIQTPSQP